MSTPAPPPSGSDPSRIRVGDTERTAALDALGEHLSSGRLSLDEYGQRSAEATQARTVADLRALFDDLPPPHPDLPGPLPAVRPAADTTRSESAASPARPDSRSPAQRAAGALVAASGILSLLLFFWLKTWVVFLIPALVAVVTGAIWGQNWRDR